jgi:hypothetical protein
MKILKVSILKMREVRCWDSEPAERVAFVLLSGLAFKIFYLVMGLETYCLCTVYLVPVCYYAWAPQLRRRRHLH